MLKTVRVHDTDETFVEYASVRRVVELASGQGSVSCVLIGLTAWRLFSQRSARIMDR